MKKILLLVCFSALLTTLRAQTTAADNKPADVVHLRETAYDFGKIQQGRPVVHNFDLTNTGTAPLLLESVQASCGCTTPEWSKEPIKPGATTVIKIGYNAASEGMFTKNIFVKYLNGQVKTITITGTVYAGPTTSAPVNTSLSLLKN